MTRAVVIGKFYPPHRGHSLVVRAALNHADDVAVLVCHRRDQRIPGEVRACWLKTMHPTANVVLVPDILPEGDSSAWADFTVAVLGYAPDMVFTSEDYGETYASLMGAKHVLVDQARSAVPVSATMIRADPLRCWEYMEPCVRGYFAVRVVVVGAESTGTTTLARALADHYRTSWVPEFGRMYAEGKMTGPSEWATTEFEFIARTQDALEDRLAETCARILICDTDSFATEIWHERYVGSSSGEVRKLSSRRQAHLYLLTDIDIPFVQDGTRDGEHIRAHMHARFLEELTMRRRPFLVVSGDHDQRMDTAIAACDKLLADPPNPLAF